MTKNGFICKDGASCYYVHNDGMGNFLNPPGDAEHLYSIYEERGGYLCGSYSLRSCLENDWIPRPVKIRAHSLLQRVYNAKDEKWIQSVYNYFRSCYSPDGIDRGASDCKIDQENKTNPEWHLAVMYIREWDKDHSPRLDLIANNGSLGDWSKD